MARQSPFNLTMLAFYCGVSIEKQYLIVIRQVWTYKVENRPAKQPPVLPTKRALPRDLKGKKHPPPQTFSGGQNVENSQ